MKPVENKRQAIQVAELGPSEEFMYLIELQRLAMEADYVNLLSRDPERAPDQKQFAREWLQQCSDDFREWYERLVEESSDRLPTLYLQARRGLKESPALA